MYETVPLGAKLPPYVYTNIPGLPGGLGDVIDADDYRKRYISAARPMKFASTVRPLSMGIPLAVGDPTPALFARLNPQAPHGGQRLGLGDFFTTEDVGGDTALETSTMGIPLEASPVSIATEKSGLGGLLDSVFNTLGFRDPIAADYPGMTDQQAYQAVTADVDLAVHKLPGLRSAGTQQALARKLFPIQTALKNLGAAFSGGGQVGKNERDKLAQAVLDNDDYTKEWRQAKAKYGYMDPDTGATEGPVPASAAPSGLPMALPTAMVPEIPWYVWAAGGVVAILLLKKSNSRGFERAKRTYDVGSYSV